MTRSHLTVTSLVLLVVLFATSCSQLNSTTVIGEGTTAAGGDPRLAAAITNDVIFQSDPVTTDLAEATCIGEQTVGEIGWQRLAEAGVTVSFPNPLAADLTEAEMAEVVQVIEECTGVRTSATGAENATGALENVAAPAEADADEAAQPAEPRDDHTDAPGQVREAASAAVDAEDVGDADSALATEELAAEEVATHDESAQEVTEQEVEADQADAEAAPETVPAAETAAVEPATSLTDADLAKLADYFGLLGAQTSEQAQCMVASVVAELDLTTETAAALMATSPLPMPERRAVNRSMVSCMDMRPLIEAILETSGMPADQVRCLAANLDIQGQVEVFSNISAIVDNPYQALPTHLGNNPALAACGI